MIFPTFSQWSWPLRQWIAKQYRWHLAPALRPLIDRINLFRISSLINGRRNRFDIHAPRFRKFRIEIHGDDNRLIIGPDCFFKEMTVKIYGNRNLVKLGSNVGLGWSTIHVFGDEGEMDIGDNTAGLRVDFAVTESRTRLLVGKSCMMATHIEIRTGDSHGIYNAITGERLNHGKDVILGEKVWLGTRCLILKGSRVGPGCVVGAGTILSGDFSAANCIIAGIPPRVIREGVVWTEKWPDSIPPQP